MASKPTTFEEGARVYIRGQEELGPATIIKFVGITPHGPGEWVGLELDKATNMLSHHPDGVFGENGQFKIADHNTYFTAAPRRGALVQMSLLTAMEEYDAKMKAKITVDTANGRPASPGLAPTTPAAGPRTSPRDNLSLPSGAFTRDTRRRSLGGPLTPGALSELPVTVSQPPTQSEPTTPRRSASSSTANATHMAPPSTPNRNSAPAQTPTHVPNLKELDSQSQAHASKKLRDVQAHNQELEKRCKQLEKDLETATSQLRNAWVGGHEEEEQTAAQQRLFATEMKAQFTDISSQIKQIQQQLAVMHDSRAQTEPKASDSAPTDANTLVEVKQSITEGFQAILSALESEMETLKGGIGESAQVLAELAEKTWQQSPQIEHRKEDRAVGEPVDDQTQAILEEHGRLLGELATGCKDDREFFAQQLQDIHGRFEASMTTEVARLEKELAIAQTLVLDKIATAEQSSTKAEDALSRAAVTEAVLAETRTRLRDEEAKVQQLSDQVQLFKDQNKNLAALLETSKTEEAGQCPVLSQVDTAAPSNSDQAPQAPSPTRIIFKIEKEAEVAHFTKSLAEAKVLHSAEIDKLKASLQEQQQHSQTLQKHIDDKQDRTPALKHNLSETVKLLESAQSRQKEIDELQEKEKVLQDELKELQATLALKDEQLKQARPAQRTDSSQVDRLLAKFEELKTAQESQRTAEAAQVEKLLAKLSQLVDAQPNEFLAQNIAAKVGKEVLGSLQDSEPLSKETFHQTIADLKTQLSKELHGRSPSSTLTPSSRSCNKLKAGTERFPSAFDLIKAFLKESHLHATTAQANVTLPPALPTVAMPEPVLNHKALLRASALTQLAARVVHLLDISVEDIERDIPIKHQRQLFDAVANLTEPSLPSSAQEESGKMKLNRWIIRSVSRNLAPEFVFAFKSQRAVDNQRQVDLEIQEAIKWLISWVSQTRPSIEGQTSEVRGFFAKVAYEIAEFMFSHMSEWDSSLEYFLQAQTLASGLPPNTISLNKLQGFLYVLKELASTEGIRLEAPSQPTNLFVRLEQAKHNPDELMKVLSEDNESQSLALDFRLALETDPSLAPQVQQRIIASNIIRACIGGDTKALPSTSLKRLDATEAAAPARAELIAQLCNLLASKTLKPFSFNITASVLLNIIAKTPDLRHLEKLQGVFDSKADSASSLETLAKMIQVSTSAKQISSATGFHQSTDLLRSLFSTNIPEVVESLQRINQTGMANRILVRRIQGFFSLGDEQSAAQLFAHFTPIGPEVAIKTSILLILETYKPTPEYEPLAKEFAAQATDLSPEDLDLTFNLFFAPLMTASRWEVIAQIANCWMAAPLAKSPHLQLVAALAELQLQLDAQQGDQMEVEGAERELIKAFDTFVSVASTPASPGASAIHWNHRSGILHSITNASVLLKLSSLLQASVAFIRKNFHSQSDVYMPDSLTAESPAKLFIQRNKPSPIVNSRFVGGQATKILDSINKETLLQLLHLNPNLHDISLTLGEVNTRLQNYKSGAKFFLLGGGLESAFWTEFGLPEGFLRCLKQMIRCFTEIKDFTGALILLQFASPIDYNEAFQLAKKVCTAQTITSESTWLKFVWELPILEILTYLCAKNGNEKGAQAVVSVIAQPELNEHTNASARKKFVHSLKKKALAAFAKHYVAHDQIPPL